jgi:nucleoside-diphosphate-sugar epimerase
LALHSDFGEGLQALHEKPGAPGPAGFLQPAIQMWQQPHRICPEHHGGWALMKKVLLVGGAGYIGSVLAHELLERGYAVRILDRMYFGDQGLADIRDRVEIVVGDMRAMPALTLDNVEAVINIAGLSNDPTAEYNPAANYAMNTTASVELAQACIQRGVRRYIYASSCSIYDFGVLDHNQDVILDETADVQPRAAYSSSKFAAEKGLLPLASEKFCVSILRKGTLFGFSPRMRYDLVVNTFVKDAMSKGQIRLHYGGEMWRPLVEIRDAARAYIALIQAESEAVNGQIFNLVYANLRISELALRVREVLRELGVKAEIKAEYAYKGVRNYRVTGEKLYRILNFRPKVTVEESVRTMVQEIRRANYTDFENPKYYNISWMRLLEEANKIVQITGSVFDVKEQPGLTMSA